MKKIAILLAALALTGCHNGYRNTSFPVTPSELKDCKFFELTNSEGARINVARCPNSTTTTTYKVGKSTGSSVVIDGVEYTRKDEQ